MLKKSCSLNENCSPVNSEDCTLSPGKTDPDAAGESHNRLGGNRKTVSVIQPVRPVSKQKVGAYARVSKGSENQKTSIDYQCKHFASLAAEHSDWEFAGVYIDVISGTKMETRPELNRMLNDCAQGRINLVLTKSISRFARNTTDLLEMVRKLTATGTDIVFERENLDTRIMGSELLLSILASLAEDESHNISSNCRWGIQKRFRDGTYRTSSAPYGYDLRDGTYVLNHSEAETVREIFTRTIEGDSMTTIADDLNRRSVPTKHTGQLRLGEAVHAQWTIRSIRAVLRNVVYIGNMVLQKVYTDNSFKKRRNNGMYPKYYLENHHAPIISYADFETVQAILDARRTGNTGAKKRYPFSGKLICQACGSPLYRDRKSTGRIYWVCREHRKKASNCPLPSIPEDTIWSSFETLLNRMKEDDTTIRTYISDLKEDDREKNKEKLEALEARLHLIDRQLSINGTWNQVMQCHADRIMRQNELQVERIEIKSLLERMTDKRIQQANELLSLVHGLDCSGAFKTSAPLDAEKEGDADVRMDLQTIFHSFVDTVTVCGRGESIFQFRCGLTVTQTGTEYNEDGIGQTGRD